MTGIGRKNDRIIIILDLERILTAEEQIKIEEIKKQELQREVIDATNF